MDSTLRCRKCGESKPYSEFYSDSRCRKGVSSPCKECAKAQARDAARRKADPNGGDYGEHREAILARYQANKDMIRAKYQATKGELARRAEQRRLNAADKSCTACGNVLSIENFYKTISSTDGYTSQCKSCIGRRQLATRAQKSYRLRLHSNAMRIFRKESGISLKELSAWLEEHKDDPCAICGRGPKGVQMQIDHDHSTNRLRAMLCSRCNGRLGYVRDDVDWMHAAADYVDHHRQLALRA